MFYRLGVRTYVELPELLKTFDLEVPQVRVAFCFVGMRTHGFGEILLDTSIVAECKIKLMSSLTS